jgi:hypothetical protein
MLLGFAGLLGSDGNRLTKVLPFAFSDHGLLERERYCRTRKPTCSDGFDIINSAVTPYVKAVVTESHQAEVLRKTVRRDGF